MQLLRYPRCCRLSQANRYGNTALIVACQRNLSSVALEILKYPTQCDLSQANEYGDTALIWACDNNMINVVREILKYPANCDLLQVNSNGNDALRCAKVTDIRELIKKHINQTYTKFNDKNFGEIKEIIKIEKKELICLFCGEDSENHMIYEKCGHAIVSCQECIGELPNNNCIICRSTNNKIKKIYFATDPI